MFNQSSFFFVNDLKIHHTEILIECCGFLHLDWKMLTVDDFNQAWSVVETQWSYGKNDLTAKKISSAQLQKLNEYKKNALLAYNSFSQKAKQLYPMISKLKIADWEKLYVDIESKQDRAAIIEKGKASRDTVQKFLREKNKLMILKATSEIKLFEIKRSSSHEENETSACPDHTMSLSILKQKCNKELNQSRALAPSLAFAKLCGFFRLTIETATFAQLEKKYADMMQLITAEKNSSKGDSKSSASYKIHQQSILNEIGVLLNHARNVTFDKASKRESVQCAYEEGKKLSTMLGINFCTQLILYEWPNPKEVKLTVKEAEAYQYGYDCGFLGLPPQAWRDIDIHTVNLAFKKQATLYHTDRNMSRQNCEAYKRAIERLARLHHKKYQRLITSDDEQPSATDARRIYAQSEPNEIKESIFKIQSDAHKRIIGKIKEKIFVKLSWDEEALIAQGFRHGSNRLWYSKKHLDSSIEFLSIAQGQEERLIKAKILKEKQEKYIAEIEKYKEQLEETEREQTKIIRDHAEQIAQKSPEEIKACIASYNSEYRDCLQAAVLDIQKRNSLPSSTIQQPTAVGEKDQAFTVIVNQYTADAPTLFSNLDTSAISSKEKILVLAGLR